MRVIEQINLAGQDRGQGSEIELALWLVELFQEFSQASSATGSKYGLGLVISRRFCQMMGGDITVESEVGRGSTFTIRLPRIVEAPKEWVSIESLQNSQFNRPLDASSGPAERSNGEVIFAATAQVG